MFIFVSAYLFIFSSWANNLQRIDLQEMPVENVKHVFTKKIIFPKGYKAPKHKHPGPVIGLVTKGQIVYEVQGQRPLILKKGDTFYEAPNTIVTKFNNMSLRDSAEFFVMYLAENKDASLVTPIEEDMAISNRVKELPMIDLKKTALLMIDVQKGFDFPSCGPRNNPDADKNIASLLTAFRKKNHPIIHIQHMSTNPESPLRPGQVGNEFKDYAKPLPHELVIQKTVNSSFIGTPLERELKQRGIGTLIIAGLTINHCVSTTTRMAGNLGFKTYLVQDATHAFDFKGIVGKMIKAQVMYEIGLAELNEEFATLMNTEDILKILH